MKLFYIAFFIFCCSKSLLSQRYILEKINSPASSQNITIYDIERDASGFLWLGTNSGLYRFDGENFELYEGTGSTVRNVVIDSNDIIWSSSNLGVIKLSPSRDTFTTIKGSNEVGSIERLYVNKNDEIFILPFQKEVFKVASDTLVKIKGLKKRPKDLIDNNIDLYIDKSSDFCL